jgi:hypothetical protein
MLYFIWVPNFSVTYTYVCMYVCISYYSIYMYLYTNVQLTPLPTHGTVCTYRTRQDASCCFVNNLRSAYHCLPISCVTSLHVGLPVGTQLKSC